MAGKKRRAFRVSLSMALVFAGTADILVFIDRDLGQKHCSIGAA
jgi:hypothetical protein